jgi:hypothetical protein
VGRVDAILAGEAPLRTPRRHPCRVNQAHTLSRSRGHKKLASI